MFIFKKNQKKQQQRKHEKGRSMVEMLGVIGVIGLLTIFGIFGYQYATGAYQAGTTVDAMTKLKVLVVTKQVKREEDILIFLEKTPVNAYNPKLAEGADVLQIDISPIASRVCNHIINAKAPFSVSVKGDSCDDNEGLSFIFDELQNPGNPNTCADRCSAGETTLSTACKAGEYAQKTKSTSCGKPCYKCVGDSCPTGTNSFCPAGTGKEAGKTPSGTQCYICVTDECPTGLYKSCPVGNTAEEAGQTGKGTPCYKCFSETCAAGTSLTCAAGEVAVPKGQNAEGKTCYQCLKDECPSGSFLNCSNGFNPVVAGKTPSGKQCFRCEPMMSTTIRETTQDYEISRGICDPTYDSYIEQAKQYCRNKGSYLMTVEGLGCSYFRYEGVIVTGMSCKLNDAISNKYVLGTYSTDSSYAEHAGCEGLWATSKDYLQFFGDSRPNFSDLLCASDLSAITTNETTTTYETTTDEITTLETTTYEMTTTYETTTDETTTPETTTYETTTPETTTYETTTPETTTYETTTQETTTYETTTTSYMTTTASYIITWVNWNGSEPEYVVSG